MRSGNPKPKSRKLLGRTCARVLADGLGQRQDGLDRNRRMIASFDCQTEVCSIYLFRDVERRLEVVRHRRFAG